MQFKKNIKNEKKQSALNKIENLHPHKVILYFSMVASSIIFFFLVVAYSISMPDYENTELFIPKSFIISSFLIAVSSFSISKALPAYNEDKIKVLERSLGITLLLGLLFALFQYIGWVQLTESGVYLNGSPSESYLYVISGLHVIHLIAGMVALLYMYLKSLKARKDPVKSLILVTNPFQKMRLEMLTVYWHFMDALWLILFLYFIISI